MRTLRTVHRAEWIALLLILGLAASLRFGWPGVNSFGFDEARLSLISLRMARGGEFAAIGMPSSAGIPNLPGAAWLFAIPYLLSPDPAFATAFVAFLSLLTVVGIWLLARHAWGVWPALVAALYMAASPYSVLYSRNIWAQNLLAPLSLLWAGSAYLAIAGRRRWAVAVHVLIAGFAFQVHFAGAAFILGTLYLFFRFRWWRRLREVLVGGIAAWLLLLPFLFHLMSNPDVGEEFSAAMTSPAQADISVFDSMSRLALGVQWQYLAAGEADAVSESPAVSLVVWVLFILGIVIVAREALQPTPTEPGAVIPLNRARVFDELVIVWALIGPLFFVRHSTPVFLHYLLVSLPAFGLVVAASTRFTPTRSWALGVTVVMALVAVAWTVQLRDSLTLAGTVETPNGLGTPLGLVREAAYGPPSVIPTLLFTHGDDPNTDGEAAVFDALWWGRPHRIIQGDSLLILPNEQSTLMATLAPFQAWEELVDSGLATDVQEYPRRFGALPFVSTYYDGGREPAGFTLLQPILFEDGAQLEGWKVRWVGPRLRLSTLWRVTEPPPVGTFQQFHHLWDDTMATDPTDEVDEPVQISDVPLSVHEWRGGDRLIVMADFFNVMPGTYRVDLGHYGLPGLMRVPRADGEGNAVQLGPFDVSAPPETT